MFVLFLSFTKGYCLEMFCIFNITIHDFKSVQLSRNTTIICKYFIAVGAHESNKTDTDFQLFLCFSNSCQNGHFQNSTYS